MNTHYAAIVFSGDPAGEHEDEELRGHAPSLTLLASGPEEFCWESARRWTARHPLRTWEEVEVLTRHPSVVRDPELMRVCQIPACGCDGTWHA